MTLSIQSQLVAPEVEPLNIAIIGAGFTGLALALSISALPQHKCFHLRYTIYESHHSYSEIGAGIGFGASGHRTIKLLHPDFWESYKTIANWGEDDTWWDFVVGDRVGNGKDEEWEVTLQFKDGTTSSADLLIGADGVKSICRDLVLTHTNNSQALKARFTGKVAYRGLIPMAEAKKSIGEKAGQRMFYLGHGGHVVAFPVEGGKSMNVVAFANREEGAWEGSWVKEHVDEELKRDYLDGRWGKDVEGIMRLIKSPSSWATFYHPTAPTFHHPTLPILLIGDSAHTTAPHFGQGAGLGIEDVYILTTLLSRLPHSPAPLSMPSSSSRTSSSLPLHLQALFTAYTQIRQPRATTAVSSCNYYGRMLDMEDPVISDDLQKIEDKIRSIGESIWGYDEVGEGEWGVGIMMEVIEKGG